MFHEKKSLSNLCLSRQTASPALPFFREMMLQYAQERGLRRTVVSVPVLTPGLAAEWIQFVTPISRNMAVPIVKGMVYPLLADTARAEKLFSGIHPTSYRKSVAMALSRLEKQEVLTHWSGAVRRMDQGNDVQTRFLPSGEQ